MHAGIKVKLSIIWLMWRKMATQILFLLYNLLSRFVHCQIISITLVAYRCSNSSALAMDLLQSFNEMFNYQNMIDFNRSFAAGPPDAHNVFLLRPVPVIAVVFKVLPTLHTLLQPPSLH